MATLKIVTAAIKRHYDGTQTSDMPSVLADYLALILRGKAVGDGSEAFQDLSDKFQQLNEFFNAAFLKGTPPSSNDSMSIPAGLCYVVNGLVANCLEASMTRGLPSDAKASLQKLAWRIVAAWDAVLAGDIEHIGNHVSLEESMRFDD